MTGDHKITFGQMREAGADGIEIFCTDHKCSHCVKMSADAWPNIEGRLVCKACGRRGRRLAPDYRGSRERPVNLRSAC